MKWLKAYIKENFSNFAFFYSVLRSRLLVVILLTILVGLLDSIGLTMFLPLLQLADGGSDVNLGNLSFITDSLKFIGIELTIYKALLFLLLVFVIKGFVVYHSNIYKLKSTQILSKNIRMKIVDLFPTFMYQQFVKTDIGKIQNIFLGEMGRLIGTYNNYIAMIQGLIMITIYMLFSFVADWKFAVLVCLGGLMSNVIFKRINKLTKEKSKDISKVNNQFARMLIQYVNHFKYLKASGKILAYKDKVEAAIDDTQAVGYGMGTLNAKVSAAREPILIGIVVMVILLQITLFDARMSAIMISLLFFYRALTSVVSVQSSYNNTLANQGAIDNIMSFLHELKSNKETVGAIPFERLKRDIILNNVSFSYDDTVVLNSISLTITKNQTIAFVGESGSGKTTLASILIKLLTSKDGEILIDSIDINRYNQFLYQSKIGYISQEPAIFNDTIFNNVTFWDVKTPETIKRFESALKRAALLNFVNDLKDKGDSLLGNNGINLSGGQKQRVSIARELYKDVQLLVLDEATSSLDSETEKDIQDSIDLLKGDTTIVIIAHRLSTIKNADMVYLLDKGKLIGQGSFNELTQISERFKRMVELQEL